MRLHPATVMGLGVSALIALALLAQTASAQQPQPREDTISVDVSDDGCTVRIDWHDGTEISSKLRVAVDDLFQSDRTLDDDIGVDNSRSFTLPKLDPGDHVIDAILRGFTSSQDETEGDLDTETVETDCEPPAPTATAVPPTATPVSPTATPAPTATPTVIEKIQTIPSDTFAFCADGRLVNLTKGERCPAVPAPIATQAPVVVTQPTSVIRAPNTGSGGLLP